MQRREFLKLTGGAAIAAGSTVRDLAEPALEAEQIPPRSTRDFYVSTSGNDKNQGTAASPFATLQRAQRAVRHVDKMAGPIRVLVDGGTYYLEHPLVFVPEDSGTSKAPISYSAQAGEQVTLSGARKLTCHWKAHKDGIMMTPVPAELDFTQLFVNGKRMVRARYPSYDPSDPGKSGYITAAGAIKSSEQDPHPGLDEDMMFEDHAPRGIHFDPATFTKKHWTKPESAEIDIFQAAYWGNLRWQIKAIDPATHSIWFGAGGQQIGAKWDKAPAVVNANSRFYIDNVFEELDAPGEWFLDKVDHILYYYPVSGLDLNTARIEVPILDQMVLFMGTQETPVHDISLDGFRMTQTCTTYLKSYDVPSLSDWSVHRGGTVFAEGTRNCSVSQCWFDAIGGNAVFVNNYNRGFTVTGCKFTESGDSAICFVGDMEKTTGTQRAFPFECVAHNNLIHDCGIYGKQIAGVYISRAKHITVSHNLIYNMPRAGICMGDGTWGGHIIEYNHIYNTVRETSDHGPFNAWGRDRAWSLAQSHGPYTPQRSMDAWQVLADVMKPVIVRNNFFDEKSGWGLNLDDGASNYEIYNNISVGGVAMKLREGAYRTVYNNIWYMSRTAPCFHVGNDDNHDRYFNNIVVMDRNGTEWPTGWPWWPQMFYSVIAPPANGPWVEEIDHNCFYSPNGEFQAVVDQLRSEDGKRNPRRYNFAEWQGLGFDRSSVFADPLFVDAEKRNFTVRPESPALKLGFKNFEMSQWGLTAEFSDRWQPAKP